MRRLICLTEFNTEAENETLGTIHKQVGKVWRNYDFEQQWVVKATGMVGLQDGPDDHVFSRYSRQEDARMVIDLLKDVIVCYTDHTGYYEKPLSQLSVNDARELTNPDRTFLFTENGQPIDLALI